MDGIEWDGKVADTSARGVAVAFPHGSTPHLTLGDRLLIVFHGGGIEDEKQIVAWVKSAADSGAHMRYGFSFTDVDQVARNHLESFNRRTWIRVVPDRKVHVALSLLDGPEKGAKIAAFVADVSAGGMAILLTGPGAQLEDTTEVQCTTTFPGEDEPRTLTGKICNRAMVSQRLRLGVSFEVDEGNQGPVYERSWDCDGCGSRGLLATSHARCPACSEHRPDSSTYLRAWSAIEPQTAHIYWGDDQFCRICTAPSSAAATFCGRCGSSLA